MRQRERHFYMRRVVQLIGEPLSIPITNLLAAKGRNAGDKLACEPYIIELELLRMSVRVKKLFFE